MVVAKINQPSIKLPTAPLHQPVIKSETAKPEAAAEAKPATTIDTNVIKSKAKDAATKLTGELKLPERCFPLPGPGPMHIDLDSIKDNAAVDRADANGDDKLNADEFKKTQSGWDQLTDKGQFDRYDGDNDGYVTKEEFHKGAEGDRFRDAIRDQVHQFPNEGIQPFRKEGNKVGEAAGKVVEGVGDAIGKLF